jgi:hypothetical protein
MAVPLCYPPHVRAKLRSDVIFGRVRHGWGMESHSFVEVWVLVDCLLFVLTHYISEIWVKFGSTIIASDIAEIEVILCEKLIAYIDEP